MAKSPDVDCRKLLETRMFLTPDEAAAILVVSQSTVYNMLAEQELPHKKIRGQKRISTEDLKRFLQIT